MADPVTNKLSEYVNRMGINISELSRRTGIPDGILRRSLVRRERDLRAHEFVKICEFVDRNPMDFQTNKNEKEVSQGNA